MAIDWEGAWGSLLGNRKQFIYPELDEGYKARTYVKNPRAIYVWWVYFTVCMLYLNKRVEQQTLYSSYANPTKKLSVFIHQLTDDLLKPSFGEKTRIALSKKFIWNIISIHFSSILFTILKWKYFGSAAYNINWGRRASWRASAQPFSLHGGPIGLDTTNINPV